MLKEIVALPAPAEAFCSATRLIGGYITRGTPFAAIADLYEKAFRPAPCQSPFHLRDFASVGWRRLGESLKCCHIGTITSFRSV